MMFDFKIKKLKNQFKITVFIVSFERKRFWQH